MVAHSCQSANLMVLTESLSQNWALFCEPLRIGGVNIEIMIGTEDDIDRWRNTVKRGLKVGPRETLLQIFCR